MITQNKKLTEESLITGFGEHLEDCFPIACLVPSALGLTSLVFLQTTFCLDFCGRLFPGFITPVKYTRKT